MTIRVAVWLLSLVARTWRVRVCGHLPEGPCVIAFWHGTMLPVWWVCRNQGAAAMVSMSKDGSYLATILEQWGYKLVRGSSSQGGTEALATLVEVAKTNKVMLTPDGPRGPRLKAKPGAVITAHRSGVPLVSVRVDAKRSFVFRRSWDLFSVPLPWSSVVVVVDQPQHVPGNATPEQLEQFIRGVETRLQQPVQSTAGDV